MSSLNIYDIIKGCANAYRTASGTTELVPVGDLEGLISALMSGGEVNHDMEDGIITRTSTEYVNDRVTTIGNSVFEDNTVIESISFPNVVTFTGANQFWGCTNLKNVYFPKLENIGMGNTFRTCSSLEEIILPAIKTTPSFYQCTSLKKADFGTKGLYSGTSTILNIGSFASTNLDTLVLRYTHKCYTLSKVSLFDDSPFAEGGTGGTVYVPEALLEEYKNATNWSTLYAQGTCNFVAIEGSEYE